MSEAGEGPSIIRNIFPFSFQLVVLSRPGVPITSHSGEPMFRAFVRRKMKNR